MSHNCHIYPIHLSVMQSAFASTSDRPLCFPRACVGLIGPHPSDYPQALFACYYFLQAVFLLALGLWSSLPDRQLSHDTSYSFLTLSVFCFFLSTEKIDESYTKGWTRSWPIMSVHSKILICTFTFSDNSLLSPQDDSQGKYICVPKI